MPGVRKSLRADRARAASGDLPRRGYRTTRAGAVRPDANRGARAVLYVARGIRIRRRRGGRRGDAAGEAPFALTCTGGTQLLTVTVQTNGAPFELGEAQAVASVVIQRGRTLQAQDSQVVRVVPTVTVDLADTAFLTHGGQAVLIDVTTACNPGADAGGNSFVVIKQGGDGFFGEDNTAVQIVGT